MEIDAHFVISGLTGIVTTGVGLGVKLLNDKLRKLNGSVAANSKGIHCHDVALAKLGGHCEQMKTNQEKTDQQIQEIAKNLNKVTLNCAALHPDHRKE